MIGDDEPFRSPEAAIKFAFRVESKDIVKISSYFRELRGSTVRQRRSTGPWDEHAQAAMILALIDRHMNLQQHIAARALYTIPTNHYLEERKATDCRLLGDIVRADAKTVPYWYAIDVIREWAGYRRQHTDVWWAKNLARDVSTLRRWSNGNASRGLVGIIPMMQGLVSDGTEKVVQPMRDGGLIP